VTKVKNNLTNYLRTVRKHVTLWEVTPEADNREAMLQFKTYDLGWVEYHSHESMEKYEEMKTTCKNGLTHAFRDDEL
jgi:hypothetical protein